MIWLRFVPKGQIDNNTPDSKGHGANMGPIWGRQDPGGPHVCPINLAIWDIIGSVNSLSWWCIYASHGLSELTLAGSW